MSRKIYWNHRVLRCLCALIFLFGIDLARADEGQGDEADDLLPRVLILGDALAEGYAPHIKTRLDGIAEVTFMRWACSRDAMTLLEEALEDDPWDVIAFNIGLVDLTLIDGQPAVSVDEYEQNLGALITRMLDTSPSYKVYVTMIPVPEGVTGWGAGVEVAYNEAALRQLQDRMVTVEDVHDRIALKPELYKPGEVYLTDAGYAYLAMLVSEAIEEGLY